MSRLFTAPPVQCGHKPKKVISAVGVLYIIDLQIAVAAVVARVCKVVWG